MSFQDLKKSRSGFDTLQKSLETSGGNNTQKSFADDRFWKIEMDKSGNGYAEVRFLPAPTGEDMPWVQYWDHGFQGPGGWYIEKSLTTLNKQDPVSEYNTELWNSGVEANKDIARKQKRRLHYVSNIYVVSDPAHPENEGKVFLYRFGKKIFEMLKDKMQPQFEDETPVNPFDLWEGANFKIKLRKVDGFWNYDKSEFSAAAPLFDNDDQLEATWNSQHSLQGVIAPDQFKSYDELKEKLDRVLGLAVPTATAASRSEDMTDVAQPSPMPSVSETSIPSTDADEDDNMSYFEKLANDVN
jgi:hypothetical protein|tara:strand:+ start:940 stop:1836 length:897 start_codon:yes stop_codon:yes gene_type:complete